MPELRDRAARRDPPDLAVAVREPHVAQVEGELLSKLGVSEPFGRFAALLPGCVPPKEINVVARGANGEFLGSQRGRFEIRDFCHPAAAAKAAGS